MRYAPKLFRRTVRRRDLIIGTAGSILGRPLAVHGQQASLPVIGFVTSGSPETRRGTIEAFHKGLAETGYVEGKNVALEFRWAGDRYDRFPELVEDLVKRPVSVIVAASL